MLSLLEIYLCSLFVCRNGVEKGEKRCISFPRKKSASSGQGEGGIR